jgi:transcriptional regulator with XRE-family HTH domain
MHQHCTALSKDRASRQLAHGKKIVHAWRMPEPVLYRDLVARNIAAERERRSLSQADLAARMSGLGFRWVRQTVTEAERPGGRKITVEEVIGLSAALGVPVDVLILPPPGAPAVAAMPGGRLIVFRGTGRSPADLDALRELGDVEFAARPDSAGPDAAAKEQYQQLRRVVSFRDGGRVLVEPAEED